MSQPRSTGAKSVALSISGAAVVLILCLAGVAAISAPKFMRFQDRSRQSECKMNLRSFAVAERSFYAEHDRYSAKPGEVGFSVEKGNRYQYRLGPGDDEVIPTGEATVALLDAALPPAVKAKLGVQGACPACELTASCVGNVDSDEALDVWSVTVGFQKEGEQFSPVGGELLHHQDDTQR